MKIKGKWASWKIGATVGVSLLVLADIVLCVVLWQMARQGPAEMATRRDQLARTAQQLQADVARGQRIRASLPQVGKDCDEFYKNSFLDSRTVYSTVNSDISAIAAKSGVKATDFAFKPKPVPNRSVSELDINMTVQGDYPSLLKFVNGIERSKNFYFLNQLQLAEGSTNGVRLQIDLHTYYRTEG
jgi:Tfp pilus assembly protein PilO